MKKILLIILSIFLSLNIFLTAGASTQEYSWYINFNKGEKNSRPSLPTEADFVSDFNTITIGKEDEKCIYLTFDAGYENGNVEKTLDILKKQNVPGAFFILPHFMTESAHLVKRMKDEGHLICNHSKSHRNMSSCTMEEFSAELKNAEKILYESTGITMDKYYRPPEGRFSKDNLKFAQDLGYTTVFWSLAHADWDNNKQPQPQKALNLLLSRVHNGCVLLLHPTSATNAAILEELITTLKAEGYTFKSLSEYAR